MPKTRRWASRLLSIKTIHIQNMIPTVIKWIVGFFYSTKYCIFCCQIVKYVFIPDDIHRAFETNRKHFFCAIKYHYVIFYSIRAPPSYLGLL